MLQPVGQLSAFLFDTLSLFHVAGSACLARPSSRGPEHLCLSHHSLVDGVAQPPGLWRHQPAPRSFEVIIVAAKEDEQRHDDQQNRKRQNADREDHDRERARSATTLGALSGRHAAMAHKPTVAAYAAGSRVAR